MKNIDICWYGLEAGKLNDESNRNTIIDFESSSKKRITSNVSAATQAIFIGTGLAKIIRLKIDVPRKDKIIRLVRNYKKLRTQESFDELLFGLKL